MSSLRTARALVLGLLLPAWGCADRGGPPPKASIAPPQVAQPQQEHGAPRPQADGGKGALEACVDAQLAARRLNPFGDAAGTVYAGGTPLFDETGAGGAGQKRARVPWVLERRPEIASACAGLKASPSSDLLNDR